MRYSAEVKVLQGRQTDLLRLEVYDTQDTFIVGGNFS